MKLSLSLLILLSIVLAVVSVSVKRSQWPGDISFPDSRFERDENFNVVRRCVLMNCALYRKLKFGSTSSRGNRRNRYGNYRKLYSSRRKDMRSRDEIAGVDKRAFEKFLVEALQRQEQ